MIIKASAGTFAPPASFFMNERELTAACQRGDREALRAMAERFYDSVFRVAFSLTSDRDRAEDLTQETFTASIRAIRAFRGESGLFTWLVAILRRQWMNRRRSEGRLKVVPEIGERAAPEEDSDRRYAREELAAAMGRLDEESRAILTLYHAQELKYEEIARALDVPIGTVKSRLHDARRKLRILIKGSHAV
jgi:RNA polymerase sigma-70 factor (ECF subfamily)